MVFVYGIDVKRSILDSLLFNFTLGFLGLSIWSIVRWNPIDRGNTFNIIITHVLASALLIMIWIGINTFVLGLMFEEYKGAYDHFMFSNGWRIFHGLFVYTILTLMYYGLINQENLQQRIHNEEKLKNLIKEAELSALKSQINPHFLFNSLNSISSLTMSDPGKAQEMIIQLSEFLRYTIKNKEKDLVSLEDELDNIELYLNIEKIRFGDKIITNNEIEDYCYPLRIPSMILQPLYENAIKYGVSERTEPTTISTHCFKDKYYMRIIIKNEMSDQAPRKRGAGLGLKNIEERLRLIYQQSPLMSYEKSNGFFIVRISIPIEKE
jgi:LytS/YehU family sensor histidine kinase